MLSNVSGLFSETELFAAPIRSVSLKQMGNRCLSWTGQGQFGPIFIAQSTFVVTVARTTIIHVAVARNTLHTLAKSIHKYYAAMMLRVNVLHHGSSSLALVRLVYEFLLKI